jgi:peptidoglycan L-alanyl-D-glutamate endopeptidase CwlK
MGVDLTKLWPPFRSLRAELLALCAARGTVYTEMLGLRSIRFQDKLYAAGRTLPGKIVTNARGGESCHNYGIAEDVLLYLGPDVVDNRAESYLLLAHEGRKLGLQVGVPGLNDYGHIQVPCQDWFGVKEKELLARLKPTLLRDGLEACWAQLDRLKQRKGRT